jgi:hypothetical protein
MDLFPSRRGKRAALIALVKIEPAARGVDLQTEDFRPSLILIDRRH